ncbi:MAG: long-chain fatty acid--CoA ligase [Polyangiaceae bacterium]|jgi:fatty-acyl-CoA synthase|nr:long-chain fatty acid--CoA ligase [Polyangiaceae bacterium]
MLEGRMMHVPLTLTHFLERARTLFGRSEIVSRLPDGRLERSTYGEACGRMARLASALRGLGVRPGDRVATLCWNHARHLEAYLAVPAMGAVVHTLNLRLHPDELAYIAAHAEDAVVIVDRSLYKLWSAFKDRVPSVRHVIVVPDDGPAPEGTIDYEALVAGGEASFDFPVLDENAAAMLCYTSGTTGNPKGVLYSHRSCVLHSMAVCARDGLGVGNEDSVMPVVPMFHAAAWGLPYASVACGAKLVFPGPRLDPPSLLELLEREQVTLTAGVPTIWLGILQALDREPKRWNLAVLRSMVVGGSAAPAAMIDGFRERHGLEVLHAWGMTELNPLGTVARVKAQLADSPPDVLLGLRASQGMPVPLVEQRHTNDEGRPLPWDGQTFGELEVRGPWVAASYYGDEGKDRFTADGWFKTGDVVTIDPEGYVRIVDRSKDVIKSGGEWISSVALENALMGHPAVLEAAVFAAQHPKWGERPVAAVVLKEGAQASEAELGEHLAGSFAKYCVPDKFLFLKEIPRTSTGKFLKTKLREMHGDVFAGGGGG